MPKNLGRALPHPLIWTKYKRTPVFFLVITSLTVPIQKVLTTNKDNLKQGDNRMIWTTDIESDINFSMPKTICVCIELIIIILRTSGMWANRRKESCWYKYRGGAGPRLTSISKWVGEPDYNTYQFCI